jgi:methionine aminotransferase
MSTQNITPSFPSRLPTVGTTIFTVMSALATKHQAINLGQGFPDFPCDRNLIDKVNEAMLNNHNQKFRIYTAITMILNLKSPSPQVAHKEY